MLWFEKHPEVLQNLIDQLRASFPTMQVVIQNKKTYIRGSLYIIDPETDREIDRFGIEIGLPDDYPHSVPSVTETEDRIPKTIDRHFMSDGSACLFFRDEQHKFYNKKTSIIDFIKIPVYNFFLSQSYYELTGKWIFGTRPHGRGAATWDYYAEELGTDDIYTIGGFLCFLASEKLNVKQKCYCGSDKPLVNCHIKKVIEMRKKVSITIALQSLQAMTVMRDNLQEALKNRMK
jgi:hypothetical protein